MRVFGWRIGYMVGLQPQNALTNRRRDSIYADVHFVCILIITGWRRSISFKSGEKRRFRRAAATTLHRFILNVLRVSQPNATRVHIGHTISVFKLYGSAHLLQERRALSVPAGPTLVEPGDRPPVHNIVRTRSEFWFDHHSLNRM